MITVRRAMEDDKRRRLLLTVGSLKFHITRKEALRLRNQLNRFKLQ